MSIQMSATASITSSTSVADLQAILTEVPSHAKISVSHFRGDQREPSYSTLTFRWTSGKSYGGVVPR